MTKTIYVAGYPKSGTTWLTRLLGDSLNCPTGGSLPSEDLKEPATEGLDRPTDIVIRKGHYVLFNGKTDRITPKSHHLAWRNLTDNEHVVFMIRDPRDIVVSGAHHWKTTPKTFLTWMCNGTNGVRLMGRWANYIESWLGTNFTFVMTNFENIYRNEHETIIAILEQFGLPYDFDRVVEAYDRQRFKRRKLHILKHGDNYNLGQDFNLRFMRKGKVGDWRNHFTREMGQKAHKHFGELMMTMGYIGVNDWWEKLSL